MHPNHKPDVDAYVTRRLSEGATQTAIAAELGVAQSTLCIRIKRLRKAGRDVPRLSIPIECLNYDILEDIRDETDFYLGRATNPADRARLAEVLVRIEGIMQIIDTTNEDNANVQEERFTAFLTSRG